MSKSRDRGQADRAAAHLEVTVMTGAGASLAGVLRELSLTSAFVECPDPLPEGTACRVIFPRAGSQGAPVVAGRVARREAAGMAVEFLGMIALDCLHFFQECLRAEASEGQSSGETRGSHRTLHSPLGASAGHASSTLEFLPGRGFLPFSREDFCTIVCRLWETLLRMEVEPLDARVMPPAGEPGLTGRVPLTGSWQREIVLECPLPLGDLAAGILFGTDGGPAPEDQIRDTVAELTNITAGNIKRLLPVPCDLGLPEVESGPGPRRLQGRKVLEVAFRHADQVFRVALALPSADARPGSGSKSACEVV
jgi:chemotaxis protein CheX